MGDVREWETTEYVRDVNWQGEEQKGLIVLGYALSEELEMEWLKPRFPDTIIAHHPSGDSFHFV